MKGLNRTRNEITGGIYFSAVIQGRDITVVLPPELQPALSGFPDQSTVFAGRDADLRRLMETLDPANQETPAVQVSTLSGLAGVGKTELVLQAAHAALRNGWFPGGVLFVDMFGYDPQRRVEAGTALEGMLQAAGISGEHIPAEVQDRSRLFSSVLAAYANEGKPILVVVDNVASSAQARPLLPAGGKAVITSRHKLADIDARLLELDTLTPQAGAVLLGEQLNLSLGTDTRVVDYPDDALSIAQLCGGLPLALRIVAALLAAHPTRPLLSMAADLKDARTRLDEIRYTGAEGEVAVRSAFDLSYRQVETEQARTFRLIALNPGPEMSTEAASAMAAVDKRTMRWHLEELARAHLIEDGSSYGRWRMHDLIRIYAVEQTQAHGDWEEPLTQLLLYYTNTAADARGYLNPEVTDPTGERFPDRKHALAWLDAEYPNLAGIARFYPDHELVADLALDLWRFFELRRHFDDWIALTTRALGIARRLQDRNREGRALSQLGGALRQVRRFEEAIVASQAAAIIYRELGDRRGEGIALNNLAAAQAEAGRFEEVIRTYQDTVAIFRETSDPRREGIALTHLGAALMGAKRFEKAITAYEEAAVLFRDANDGDGEGNALTNLGNALQQSGLFDRAIAVHKEAMAIFRNIDNRNGEGRALNNLGATLLRAERFEEAIPANQDAVLILHECGDLPGEGRALLNLGNALRMTGQPYEAISTLQEAVVVHRQSGDRNGEAQAQENLGRTLRETGRFEECLTPYQTSAAIFHEIGNRPSEGRALNGLGGALREAKRFEDAISAHQRALTCFRETGDRGNEGDTLVFLGGVLGYGRMEEAMTACRDAATIFRDIGDQGKERSSLEILGLLQTTKRELDSLLARMKAGRFEEVITDLQKTASLLHQVGDRHGQGVMLSSLGTALVGAGQLEEGIAALEDAAAIFRETGDRYREEVVSIDLHAAQHAHRTATAAARHAGPSAAGDPA